MRRSKYVGVALLAAAVFLSIESAAGAGLIGSDLLQAKVAKHAEGPYKSEITSGIARGKTRVFYARVKNKTGTTQPAALFSSPPGPSYTVKWFRGKTDITSSVNNSGFEFSIPAEGRKLFRVKVRRHPDASALGDCVPVNVEDGVDDPAFAMIAFNQSVEGCNQ